MSIDFWIMVLPEELEIAFQEKLVVYEKEKKMPYVTSIERSGIKKGEVRLLRRLLQQRFGKLPAWVEKRLRDSSTKDLEHWSDRVLDAVILEDVFT